MAEFKKKPKKQNNQTKTDQELRHLRMLIERLDSNVERLLKKMKEKN